MASSENLIAANPDAALLAAIEDWKQAWGEVHKLEDDAPGLDDAATKAVRLERKIARMPAMTVEGYHAKVEVLRAAEFDDDLLLNIMFALGRDAGRLGIEDDPPELRANY
jgi:hypothetical protein